MGTFDNFSSTENPNLILVMLSLILFGFFLYLIRVYPNNWQIYIVSALAGGLFGYGFYGLNKTQNLKDEKTQKEIKLLNEKINAEADKREGQRLENEKLLTELAKNEQIYGPTFPPSEVDKRMIRDRLKERGF